MIKFTNKSRNRLLASAATAMAVSIMASGAQAAETTITPLAPAPTLTADAEVTAHKVVDAVLANLNPVIAAIAGTNGGVGKEVSPTGTSSISVNANDVHSVALGNNFANSVDLALLANAGLADGVGSLGFTVNVGPVSSTVGGSDVDGLTLPTTDDPNVIAVDLDDFQDGSVAAIGNSIVADATANDGTTSLAGIVPNTYTSSSEGASALVFDPADTTLPYADWLDATGSVVASTVQISGADVTATAQSNRITLDLISTGDNTIVSAPALDDNTIGANAKGNSSDSTIDIAAGGAPTFAGSAVVTNAQINSVADALSLSATNDFSTIVATVGADDGFVNTLNGSLTVDGNTVASSASGNESLGSGGQAGNRVVLADGLSFDGAGTSLPAVPGADIAYDDLALAGTATADIVIYSSQGNTGQPASTLTVWATTSSPQIGAEVQAITDGAVSVSDNAVTAAARGNSASNAFSTGEGGASFDGSVAIANQQTDIYADIEAGISFAEISAYVTDPAQNELPRSTVTVAGNTVSATAYGNQTDQAASLRTVDLTLPLDAVALTGGTGPDGNVHSEGGVTVSNLQSVYNANAIATQTSLVSAEAAGANVGDSSIAVTDNVQEAVAVGNSGKNALGLAGVTGATGAGIASVQIVADDSYIHAASEGVAQTFSNNVARSSVDLTGNMERAIAYGATVGNTLGVDVETLTVDAAVNDVASTVLYQEDNEDGFVLDGYVAGAPDIVNAPTVDAAYGLLNDQSVSALVDAQAIMAFNSNGTAFLVDIDGRVEAGSSVANDANAYVAAAYGTDAANAASLKAGNLASSDGDFVSVLNLTNVQTVTPASRIAAEASGSGDLVLTDIAGDELSTSSVSTSSNSIQALTYGNRAANAVSATGTNIDTSADSARGEASILAGSVILDEPVSAIADASFGLNNVQVAGGEITASLAYQGIDPKAARIFTNIAGDVYDSSIASDGNAMSSGATGNRADNLLDLSANGLATTGALTNFQVSDADIASYVGAAPQTLDYWITTSGYVCSGQWCISDAYDVVTISRLTPEEYDYLIANGWFVDGAELRHLNTEIGSVISFAEADVLGDALISYSGGGPGLSWNYVAPLADPGGVSVAFTGNIENSTISADGNSFAGSVTGNSAANAVKASGTNVADGSAWTETSGITDGQDTTAQGDFMLANLQAVGESALSSLVYNTVSIDVADSADIGTSSLSVDGNSQSPRAVANTALNSVELDATNTAAGVTLVSNQQSAAEVTALSGLDLSAPGATSASSVSLSDNSNVALAVINNVTNTVTIAATNASPVTTARDALLDADTDEVATGDHVLLNRQLASTSATADAATSLYNGDSLAPQGDSIDGSSVTVTGNTTTAEASANRAFNTLSASGSATLEASAGLFNSQSSSATVAASASTSARIALNGGDAVVALVDRGSIAIGDNTTTALARGNAATNVLNYSAGASYGADSPGASGSVATGSSPDAIVSARAAVLNVQSNTGAVTASSTDAAYGVALTTTNDMTIVGSSIGVNGNAVSASAFGNTAVNTLTVAALNGTMPTAAIVNSQYNSGPVIASVTTVTYGVTAGVSEVSGSSIGVGNNSITATAIGNNAVSSIVAAH